MEHSSGAGSLPDRQQSAAGIEEAPRLVRQLPRVSLRVIYQQL